MSTFRKQSSNNDFQHISTTGASVVSTVLETDSSPKLQLISHKSENQVPDNIQQGRNYNKQHYTVTEQTIENRQIERNKEGELVKDGNGHNPLQVNYEETEIAKSTEHSIPKSHNEIDNNDKEVEEKDTISREHTEKIECSQKLREKLQNQVSLKEKHVTNVNRLCDEDRNTQKYPDISTNVIVTDVKQIVNPTTESYHNSEENSTIVQCVEKLQGAIDKHGKRESNAKKDHYEDTDELLHLEGYPEKSVNEIKSHAKELPTTMAVCPEVSEDDDTTDISEDERRNALFHDDKEETDKEETQGTTESSDEVSTAMGLYHEHGEHNEITEMSQDEALNGLFHNDKQEREENNLPTHKVSTTMPVYHQDRKYDEITSMSQDKAKSGFLHDDQKGTQRNEKPTHEVSTPTKIFPADRKQDQMTNMFQDEGTKGLIEDDQQERHQNKEETDEVVTSMKVYPEDRKNNRKTEMYQHQGTTGLVNKKEENTVQTNEISITLKVSPEQSQYNPTIDISEHHENTAFVYDDKQETQANTEIPQEVSETMTLQSVDGKGKDFTEIIEDDSKMDFIPDDKQKAQEKNNPHYAVGQPSQDEPTNGVTYERKSRRNTKKDNCTEVASGIDKSAKKVGKEEDTSSSGTTKKVWNPFTSLSSPKPRSTLPDLRTTMSIPSYSSPYGNYYDGNVQPSFPLFGNTRMSFERLSSYHNPLMTHITYNPMHFPYVGLQHPYGSEINQYHNFRYYPNVTGNWRGGPNLNSFNSTGYYSNPLKQAVNDDPSFQLLQRQMESMSSSTPSISSTGQCESQQRNYSSLEENEVLTNSRLTISNSNIVPMKSNVSSQIEECMQSSVNETPPKSDDDVQEIPKKVQISYRTDTSTTSKFPCPLEIYPEKDKLAQSTKPTKCPEIQATAKIQNYSQTSSAFKMDYEKDLYKESTEMAKQTSINNENRSRNATQPHLPKQHPRNEFSSKEKTQCIENMAKERITDITVHSNLVNKSSKFEVNEEKKETIQSSNIKVPSLGDSEIQLQDENEIGIESNDTAGFPTANCKLQEECENDDSMRDIPIEDPSHSNCKLTAGSGFQPVTDSSLLGCPVSSNSKLNVDCVNEGGRKSKVFPYTSLSNSQCGTDSVKEEIIKPNVDHQVPQFHTKRKTRCCTTMSRGLNLLRRKFKVRNINRKKSEQSASSLEKEQSMNNISTQPSEKSSEFHIETDNQIQAEEADKESSRKPDFTVSKNNDKDSRIWFNEEDINSIIKDSEFKEYEKCTSPNLEEEHAIFTWDSTMRKRVGILKPKNIKSENNIQIPKHQDSLISMSEGDNIKTYRKSLRKPICDVKTGKNVTQPDLGKTQVSTTASNLKGENEQKRQEYPSNEEMQWVQKMAKQRNIDMNQYEYHVLKKMMLDEHYKEQWNKSKGHKSTRRMTTNPRNTEMSTNHAYESNESRRPTSNTSNTQKSETNESSRFTNNDFVSLQQGTEWRMQIKQAQRKGVQKIEPKFKSM